VKDLALFFVGVIFAAPPAATTVDTPYGEVRLGTFQEVLGVPGKYYNDHCLIRAGDMWHFFGIVGFSESSIAHATSSDLRTWKAHPDVLHATGKWPEQVHMFAPFVAEREGHYYMLYCADDSRGTQRLCLATSGDLFHWERYQGNPVIVPSVYWSAWPGFSLQEPDGQRSFGGCRDPHILRLDDGKFAAYWVSRLRADKFGPGKVCVAASVSPDLVHWQEVGPIFAMQEFHRPLTQEVESPCVVRKDGKYWLFFKHGWWTWYVAADGPFDFWDKTATRLGYAHAAEVFQWQGQWWITHCKTDPDDFMQSRSDRSRGLFLGQLDWPKGSPPRLK